MKKLALLALLIATPALACPDMEGHGEKDAAPKTADKDKKEAPKAKDAKGQEQTKPKAPDNDKSKTAKPEAKPKTSDKVSSK